MDKMFLSTNIWLYFIVQKTRRRIFLYMALNVKNFLIRYIYTHKQPNLGLDLTKTHIILSSKRVNFDHNIIIKII